MSAPPASTATKRETQGGLEASCHAPPTKKRCHSRSASPTIPPPVRRMRDKTLYFADGNFVISSAGDEGDVEEANDVDDSPEDERSKDIVIYFRVHQSLLSRDSAVFADMFTVGSAASTENMYDGVPLIEVQDKAKHLRGFLKAIYEPSFSTSSVFLPRYSSNTVTVFEGPLLLAIKYQTEVLRVRLVTHLTMDWPGKDYNAWRERKHPDEGVPNPEELLRLARMTNLSNELRTSLAVAYYALLGYATSTWLSEMLKVTDLMILITGGCKINTWLCVWIKEGTRKGIPAGPKLDLACEKCSLEEFRGRVLLDWMTECSATTSRVIEYLQKVAKKLEGHCEGICSRKCRIKVGEWLKKMAEAFYDRLEEIFLDGGNEEVDEGKAEGKTDDSDKDGVETGGGDDDAASKMVVG
ncbi:hypothetical protein BDN71DRAFT_519296 [Pleurotus eryngii]|uniref:BTB domain-containing protein n=1 Tax=Pleurotus eryngii TaxID=5323 RepID=A0A9P6D121_PLEER|nr:hypothetical protein BDN71DRAFT_519296 [Pleurotus eryngii]